MGLAADEQAVADRGEQRAEVGLGGAVRGCDVEVVDAVVEGVPEAGFGLLRRAAGEGGRAEDGDRAVVAGAAEAALFHGDHPAPPAGTLARWPRPSPPHQDSTPNLSSSPGSATSVRPRWRRPSCGPIGIESVLVDHVEGGVIMAGEDVAIGVEVKAVDAADARAILAPDPGDEGFDDA